MAIEQIAPLDGLSLAALSVPAGARVFVVRSANAAAIDARLSERNCAVTSAAALDDASGDFDAVVVADGFEQVADPVATLTQAAALAGDGAVVFLAQNATSVRARIAAFLGNDEAGVPQRRFDLAALHHVVALADLVVVDTLRVFEDDDAALRDAPVALVSLANEGPDAHTAAFVVVAARRDGVAAAPSTLSEALQAQVDAAARKAAAAETARLSLVEERDELAHRIEELEAELTDAAKAHDEMQNELALREDALLERIEVVERLQTERKHLELDIAVKNDYIADLRTEGQRWKDLHGALDGEYQELLRSRHYKVAKLLHTGLKQIPFVHGAVRFATRLLMRTRRSGAPS